jgi:hypothetical protein
MAPILTTEPTLGRANPHVVPGTYKGESRWIGFVGPLLHIVVWLGTVFGMMRLAYRPSGIDVTRLLPSAFDGSSVVASGSLSLGALGVCVALGISAFRGAHRTYGFLVSALGCMLLGMAMITITFSTSGENAAPPDAAMLVPFLVPLLTVGASIAMLEWAFWQWRTGEAGRRALSLFYAAIGGTLAFATVELAQLEKILGGG